MYQKERCDARAAAAALRRAVACRALALASVAAPAAATDQVDAWRAAQEHDLDFAVSRAAQQSVAARRGQAGALWWPTVMLSGTAGVAGSDTAANGAQFSAPGLCASDRVAFNTSVNRGTLGRWALSARAPLISHERDGMRGAREQEALRGIDKARAQANRTRQQVVQQTRTAWLGLTVGAGRIAALSQALVSTRSRLAGWLNAAWLQSVNAFLQPTPSR